MLNLKPAKKELDMIEYQASKKPKKKVLSKSETIEKINDIKINEQEQQSILTSKSSEPLPLVEPEPEKPRLAKQASLPAADKSGLVEEISTTNLNQSNENTKQQQQQQQEQEITNTPKLVKTSKSFNTSSDLNDLDKSKTLPKLMNGAPANLEQTVNNSSEKFTNHLPSESSINNLSPKSLLIIKYLNL